MINMLETFEHQSDDSVFKKPRPIKVAKRRTTGAEAYQHVSSNYDAFQYTHKKFGLKPIDDNNNKDFSKVNGHTATTTTTIDQSTKHNILSIDLTYDRFQPSTVNLNPLFRPYALADKPKKRKSKEMMSTEHYNPQQAAQYSVYNVGVPLTYQQASIAQQHNPFVLHQALPYPQQLPVQHQHNLLQQGTPIVQQQITNPQQWFMEQPHLPIVSPQPRYSSPNPDLVPPPQYNYAQLYFQQLAVFQFCNVLRSKGLIDNKPV